MTPRQSHAKQKPNEEHDRDGYRESIINHRAAPGSDLQFVGPGAQDEKQFQRQSQQYYPEEELAHVKQQGRIEATTEMQMLTPQRKGRILNTDGRGPESG